jgi:hypothetical protein
MNAGAGGIAAHRKYRADLDGFVLRQSIAREHRGNRDNGNRNGTKQPEGELKSHMIVSPKRFPCSAKR